jgi:dynein intermediate chain
MADRRRAEIEEKRAKLAELRRARDERKALLAQAQSGGDRAADVSTAIRRFDYTI